MAEVFEFRGVDNLVFAEVTDRCSTGHRSFSGSMR